MEDFEEAVEERRVLDDRGSRRSARKNPTGIDTPTSNNSGFSRPDSGPSTPGALPGSKRFMFTSDEAASSRPSSRAGFRRPGEEGRFDEAIGLRRTASSNSLAGQAGGFSTPTQSLRPSGRFEQSKPATPIPSVLTPHHLLRNPLSAAAIPRASASGGTADPGLDPTSSQPPLSLAALNTLQAKVLRAKLSDDPSAQSLQEDYDRESEKYRAYSAGGGDQGGGMWEGNKNGVDGQLGRSSDSKSNIRTEVQVLPTLNARGQLYDIGTGDGTEKELLPGNRRPKLNGKVCLMFTCQRESPADPNIGFFSSRRETRKLVKSLGIMPMMIRLLLVNWFVKNGLLEVLEIRKVWTQVWPMRLRVTLNTK
jgi:hypothetical protein